MSFLIFFALAFAPGIFWLWFFYRQDKYEPEPLLWIVKVFALGMLAVVPVSMLEYAVSHFFSRLPLHGLLLVFLLSFLVIAPIEEIAKFLVVRLGVFKTVEFNEVTDGIIYAAAAALGFASLENFFYIIEYGAKVIIIRAPLATLGHVLFSGMWGYNLAWAKFHPAEGKRLVLKGLLLAILLHGVYDFILLTNTLLALLVIPLVFLMYRRLASMIRRSAEHSPFRYGEAGEMSDQAELDD